MTDISDRRYISATYVKSGHVKILGMVTLDLGCHVDFIEDDLGPHHDYVAHSKVLAVV
jgi:hypothetical protein